MRPIGLMRLARLALLLTISGCRHVPGASATGGVLGPISLTPCTPPGTSAQMRCGVARVYENTAARAGRVLELRIVVIPSHRSPPRPDPVFVIAGGPGQTATALAAFVESVAFRDEREVVLVDQRGTSAQQALDCRLSGSSDDFQAYLEPLFQPPLFRQCRKELEQRADLRLYTTQLAVEDLDAVRAAMGYEQINLVGASYGTRFSLMYMKRYPQRVRTAYLAGLVPPAFRNPLYHARSAQEALDSLVSDCAAESRCHEAFPNLRRELDSVAAALRTAPTRLTIEHPDTRAPVWVSLGLDQFAEAIRVMMYDPTSGARVPLLIHRASRGDFAPFVLAAINANRGLRQSLRLGMLQSVICSEDMSRISDAEIVTETRGTLLSDSRVRQQKASCDVWAQGQVPADYGEDISVNVPTLLVSGTRDPVTPRQWGEETHRHLPNSVHVVLPGGHNPRGDCVEDLVRQLLRDASVAKLDLSCVASVRYPPFATR